MLHIEDGIQDGRQIHELSITYYNFAYPRVEILVSTPMFYKMKTSVHLLNQPFRHTVQHRESHNIIWSLPT